jgi:hypothetical protein
MEGNTPLPPHSTEESRQQSEVHNATTSQEEVPIPLENFRIVLESLEAYHIPEGYERQILHLNSTGEFVVIHPSDIPARSSQNPLASDPFWTADVVRSPPRLVRDIYGTGEGADAPFSYTIPPNHFTSTTTFTATPTVGPNIPSVGPRSTIPLQTAHSTMAPHIPTIPAGNAVVNQAPIGTPITPRPTLSFGFRALNASSTTTAQTTTQIVLGSSIPIQQPRGTGLGGPNPIGGTGPSLTSGFQILGTLPQTGGNPPSGGQIPFKGNPNARGNPPIGGQIPFGGYPHAGGQPQSGVHHQPQGQNVSVAPNPWSIPFQGNLHASMGQNVQTLQQPPYGQMPNPPYNSQNPSDYPPLTNTSQNISNPMYLGQNQPHMRGPTSYNYPHKPVLGPTGVPLPHQHYP